MPRLALATISLFPLLTSLAFAPIAVMPPTLPEQMQDCARALGEERYADAVAPCKAVLAAAEKSGATPPLASALSNLALAYFGQGDWATGEPYQKRVAELREKEGAPDGLTIGTLQRLAAVYRKLGRSADAAAVDARAAKTKVACEKSLSPDERAAPRTPCEAPPLPLLFR